MRKQNEIKENIDFSKKLLLAIDLLSHIKYNIGVTERSEREL